MELLLTNIANIPPKDSAIFSDMDSTLLFQTEDGFMESQKLAIAHYLDQGGILIVVTGDSKPVSENTFIKRLNYSGTAPIYVISGSGFQITKYQANQSIELFRGKKIAYKTREKILIRLEALFKTYFNSAINLVQEKNIFLSDDRFIDEITHSKYGVLLNNKPLSAPFRLEIRPNKITLAFDGRDKQSLQEYALYRQQLIDLVSSDSIIKNLLQSDNLHLIAGDTYLDIICSRKEDGIKDFLALTEAKSLKLDQKHIITMGDSANDKGLLCFPYQTNKSIQRIFVGNKNQLFQNFQENGDKNEYYYLKNMFTKGSERILKTLRQNTNKPDQEIKVIYDSIWPSTKPKILNQALDFDPYLSKNIPDPRRGLTLLIDFQKNCPEEMKQLLAEANKLEPQQPWYKLENLHLSLYSLVDLDVANQAKVLSPEQLHKYQMVIQNAIQNFPDFKVSLRGVTASAGVVLIKGYSDGAIKKLRDSINQELARHNLPINNRTPLNHISILRFVKPLINPKTFCEFIEKNQDRFLGELIVKNCKLVINDWRNQPDKTVMLKEYLFKNEA
jgi:hydroxymethylpyrimidine pyrophosphatase-like HAD family hydrolase/2'-5' RNA ligase